MTKLAMFIQEQHEALNRELAANGGKATEQTKQKIIKSYVQSGIMTSDGKLRKEYR